MADDRFFFSEDAEYFDTVDMMERHIGRWLFSEKKRQNKWQNKQHQIYFGQKAHKTLKS